MKFWHWLWFPPGDSLTRGRARLVILTCLGLVSATLALILTWLISGDLQWETVVAGTVLALLLAGLIALAHRGRVGIAMGLLIGLLSLIITTDVAAYGLGSPAAAAYFVPIVLVSCGYGLWAGLGMAALSAGATWAIAWATTGGRYQPYGPVDISHLTFNAPTLTVLFLLVATIIGVWRATGRSEAMP